jgi:hypothetical protein
MAGLLMLRVNPGHPFQHSRIDYAGLFVLKAMVGRSKGMCKEYVALFVCVANRAIHLEVVMEAPTKPFITALQWFVAQCGRQSDIYSNPSTNFVGADQELRDFIKFVMAETTQETTHIFV